MNNEIRMNVSSLIRKDGDKAIYVMFTDDAKQAEFVLPEGRLLNNSGFDKDEILRLQDYIRNDRDHIYEIAGKVNPMKAFMGKEQGV